MEPPSGLQQWIHKIEEGEGSRYVKLFALFMGLIALTFVYHLREARNFRAPEAMELAQVARNVAQGKGFTTKFIRPIDVAQLTQVRGPQPVLKDEVPDMANPPLYPLLMAGLMKAAPFRWEVGGADFSRYQPEVWIGLLNQMLFYVSMVLVFLMGRRLFDSAVGWMAAIVFAATEMYWQFTTSGLPTMLLITLVLLLVHLLISIEQQAALTVPASTLPTAQDQPMPVAPEAPPIEPKGTLWFLAMAVAVGFVLGLLMMTQYSFGLLMVAVLAWLAWVGVNNRGILLGVTTLVFLVVISPWLYRNYTVSESIFGTASYNLQAQTKLFPGNRLQRSIPGDIGAELNKIPLEEYGRKLALNSAEIISKDLPVLTGNWIAGLFLGSLLVPFRNRTIARLRWFIVAAIVLYIPAQALIKTDPALHEMPISAQNLLVVFGPLLFAYGAAVLFIFLDQIEFPFPQLRTIVVWLVPIICAAPLILVLLPPRTFAMQYPPYFPPYLGLINKWMQPEELVMSDAPWAVAWYGNRKCIWTTLDYGNTQPSDFYKVNDYQQKVSGLYLTSFTTDSRFLTEMLKGGQDGAWGRFVLESILKTNVPTGFPLKRAPSGFFPEQVFLTDRSRWRDSGN